MSSPEYDDILNLFDIPKVLSPLPSTPILSPSPPTVASPSQPMVASVVQPPPNDPRIHSPKHCSPRDDISKHHSPRDGSPQPCSPSDDISKHCSSKDETTKHHSSREDRSKHRSSRDYRFKHRSLREDSAKPHSLREDFSKPRSTRDSRDRYPLSRTRVPRTWLHRPGGPYYNPLATYSSLKSPSLDRYRPPYARRFIPCSVGSPAHVFFHGHGIAVLCVRDTGYTLTNSVVSYSLDRWCPTSLEHHLTYLDVGTLFVTDVRSKVQFRAFQETTTSVFKHLTVILLDLEVSPNTCSFCNEVTCHRWLAVHGMSCILHFPLQPIRHSVAETPPHF